MLKTQTNKSYFIIKCLITLNTKLSNYFKYQKIVINGFNMRFLNC